MSSLKDRIFGQEAVKKLTESDFIVSSTELVGIKSSLHVDWSGTILVLFYDKPDPLLYSWFELASQVPTTLFGVVNLQTEKNIAEMFQRFHNYNSLFRWASIQSPPYILSFVSGVLHDFYRGPKTQEEVLDYALSLMGTLDKGEL